MLCVVLQDICHGEKKNKVERKQEWKERKYSLDLSLKFTACVGTTGIPAVANVENKHITIVFIV